MTRQQLTLFVQPPQAAAFEALRARFNPVQFGLIAAHITLCREDELQDMELVKKNAAALDFGELTVELGPATRFSEGKGVFLPQKGANEAFLELRRSLLAGLVAEPRLHAPHLTLMHPRNSTCTDDIFQILSTASLPQQLRFDRFAWIEQIDGGPWTVLETFSLSPNPGDQ